ncbi:MAG: hypothetical protein RL065_965 [Bacteroidota bacterium]|jgi:hypothetical protein
MKKSILVLFLGISSMVASAQVTPLAPRNAAPAQTAPTQPSQADNPNAPVFKFESTSHDFGNVPEGPAAVFEYVFTNTGREPLIISDVVKSCGCTTPSWTKEPILPGKTGKIVASFDTKGRVGNFNKTLTVVSNAKQPNFQLTFGGVVLAAPPTTQENNNIQEIKLEPQHH